MKAPATHLYGARYELLELLGVGGGGSVYRARDAELSELVALKVLRKELLSDPATIERFRNEVRLARRISHRNVARMFDIGEHKGEKFLTMELVDGQSLSRRIAGGADTSCQPLPLAEVVDITEQVCAGLEAAHDSGVIHCDLKPDNLLLAANGRVVITDFGIARAFNQLRTDDEKKGFFGTPHYISPEQLDGSPLDARSDLYSLGVVLYEVLTGTPPFTGRSAVAIAAARLLDPPVDPQKLRPELPAAMSQIVLRCLAIKPAERYQRASEVGIALRSVLSRLPAEVARKQAAPVSHVRGSEVLSTDDLPAVLPVTPLPDAGSEHRIAILPLRNTGAPDDLYLTEGMTQELVDALASIKGVRVYSRGAVAQWTGREPNLEALGRELGIEFMVSGELRRSEGRLRMNVRVVRITDGAVVCARRFDCLEADLLAISDDVSAALADVLTAERAATKREVPAETRTVDLYLRARYLYGRGEPDDLGEAVRLFEQVLERAPNEAAVLTSYALSRARLWFFGDSASGEIARAAAERAAAMAAGRAETHLALAVVYFQAADLPHTVRSLRRALAQEPNLADAHELLGRILVETGPLRQGLAHLAHALALDPGLSRLVVEQARTYALLGDYDRAHALLAGSSPDVPVLPVVWSLRARFCLWQRDERRIREYLQYPELQQPQYTRPRILLALAAGQTPPELQELLRAGFGSDHSSPRGRAFFYQLRTELHGALGQTEQAVHSLARSVDAGLTDLTWVDRCPLVQPLLQDPRGAALHRYVYERALQVRETAAANLPIDAKP